MYIYIYIYISHSLTQTCVYVCHTCTNGLGHFGLKLYSLHLDIMKGLHTSIIFRLISLSLCLSVPHSFLCVYMYVNMYVCVHVYTYVYIDMT